MFYEKKLKLPQSRASTVEFANFKSGMNRMLDSNILPIKYAYNTFNFDISDGALKDGLGICRLNNIHLNKPSPLGQYPGGDVKKVWQYFRYDITSGVRDDKLIVYMSDGNLYYTDIFGTQNDFVLLQNSSFISKPNFLNYRLNGEDVLIVSSNTDEMLVWNGVDLPYRVADAPRITSMTIHYERLFATSSGASNAVWFSKELDPINWDINLESAGFIETADERGANINVLSFLDYVYVFREFGISRICAYADQTQFSVSHLFTSSGRISAKTISLCGDRIIFLTSSGLYAFDGLDTYKILDEISGSISDIDNACACFYNGKYYLACRYNFDDGETVLCESNADCVLNAVIEYNIIDKSFNVLRGIDIADFAVIKIGGNELLTAAVRGQNSEFIGVFDRSGKYYLSTLPKVWQSPYTDLGRGNYIKTLKALYLISHKPCSIIVKADGQKYSYEIEGNAEITRISPNIKFKMLSIAFWSNSADSYISHPVLQLNVSSK